MHSRLVFYVAAPALLARATVGNSLDETFNAPVLAAVIAASVLVGAGTYAVCFRCSPPRRGVVAQGVFRSNMVFVGLPIVIYAYGEDSVNAVAVLISFMVIFYNFLGAVVLVLPQQSTYVRMSTILVRTTVSVLKNPLIITCVAGILYSLTGWYLPVVLDRSLELIGRTAVVSYIMARELDGDEKLAGAVVIGSTLVSLVTAVGRLDFPGRVG